MGMSKSFPCLLLMIFFGLFAWGQHSEQAFLTHNQQQAMSRFHNEISHYQAWQDDGAALYQHLASKYDLLFFQYIDDTDGTRNFTQGSLESGHEHILAGLFQLSLDTHAKLATGRLQIKLGSTNDIEHAVGSLTQFALVLLLAYTVLLGGFYFLLSRQNASIRYAAHYIEQLPDLTFPAIESSRLKGALEPMSHALESCRNRLKSQLDKLHHENDKLQKAAYQDPITDLKTRPLFTQKLASISQTTPPQFGLMALIKASELANINQQQGRAAGDDYLSTIANCIRRSCSQYPQAEYFRISSADFAVFISDVMLKDGTKFLEQLKISFDEYQQMTKAESVAHIGLVPYQQGSDSAILLTLADTAVSIAQTLGPNSYHVQEKLSGDELFGDDRWKQAITDLLKRQTLSFFQQTVQPCRSDVEVYRELLARFYNQEGKLLPTTTVIAMAERHNMSVELDKLVVRNILDMLAQTTNIKGLFGINISAFSAHQPLFVAWLKETLGKQRALTSHLVFEINESGMQTNLAASRQFIRELHSVGARVSVEHFGMSFTSFKFFSEVRPDYIKLDGSYTTTIDTDSNNKFFVRMMVDVARRLNIRVIATSVERQEEKLTLEKLLVDGLQGYYIAKPQSMN